METKEELKGQSSQLFNPRQLRTEKASPIVLAWADTLTRNNAWPEGKSIPGFEAWLRSSFGKSRKETVAVQQQTGIPHDAGHGGQGANSPTNLAPQVRKGPEGNQTTVDKTTGVMLKHNEDHVRTRADLSRVDADIPLSQAFEQYLNLGEVEPGKFLSLADFEPYYKTKILHNSAYAPTAESAEARAQLDRLSKAYYEHLEAANKGKPYVASSSTNPPPKGEIVDVPSEVGKTPDELDLNEWRRQNENYYKPIREVVMDSNGVLRTKLVRGVRKILTPGIGGAGMALDALETATRAKEFKEDPNWMNASQLGIQVSVQFLNGVATVAPMAAPITEPAAAFGEAALMGTDMVENLDESVAAIRSVPRPTSMLAGAL